MVSVLQAGGFFGALSSAPVSGMRATGIIVPYRPSDLILGTRTARFGRKRTLPLFCAIFSVGAVSTQRSLRSFREECERTSPLFCQALQVALGGNRGLAYIYSGRVIGGFGIGGITAVAPTFVSECAPKEVRGRITGLFQVMSATGVMLAYWVNRES